MKDNRLKILAPFEIKSATENEDGSIRISGYASTNDKDRMGEVVLADAWKDQNALKDFLLNPVVLAFHDHRRPIGRVESHEVNSKGLKITARISKAAGEIVELIKDGILGAFSIGFRVKEADYDSNTDIFVIKKVELYEVSVVSVPANAKAGFNIAKQFKDAKEYEDFKNMFSNHESEEILMDKDKKEQGNQPVDFSKLAESLRKDILDTLKAEEKAKKEAEEKAAAEAKKIEATATTAAERLFADVKKSFDEKDSKIAEILESFGAELKALKEENAELETFKKMASKSNKMVYSEDSKVEPTAIEKDTAIIVAKALRMPLTETKYFKDLVEKSGTEHWASSADAGWEEEFRNRVYDAMREDLVVERAFSSIPMTTPTLHLPINPEAGLAEWIPTTSFRSSDGSSTGTAVDHELSDKTLIAYKLAAKEFLGYEEEEDSIVPLAGIIRDAVARRMARASDVAILRGAGNTGSNYDPINGLINRGASTTDVLVSGAANWATDSTWTEDLFVDMRKELGIYGLDPSRLVLFVAHDVYYEMMKFSNFKTVDVLGDRATIITGQVGSLFGFPVVVSQAFDNEAISNGTVGTQLAVLCRPENFVLGQHRTMLVESDRDVENQKNLLVATRRFAFEDIITGQATVNLEIGTA